MSKNLEHLWMPFSANRGFKAAPRLMNEAKGMYYKKLDGTKVLDATAGLWCCNAGHGHKRIVEAIQDQAAKMDFAPSFQMGHPLAFEAAEKLLSIAPSDNFQYAFFTNSGLLKYSSNTSSSIFSSFISSFTMFFISVGNT